MASETATDALARYNAKRDFAGTPEPAGKLSGSGGSRIFVVQEHHASHLHYDFRLELDGTLKSWAVPKGPSLDPQVKRMAVQVEDHPVSYAGFEGTIPDKHYGAGTVIVWDAGTWQAEGDAAAAYAKGRIKFTLAGHKLRGHWNLVRMKPREGERSPSWLLIKEKDAEAHPEADFDVLKERPGSVLKKKAAKPRDKRPAAIAPQPAKPGKRPRTSVLEGLRVTHGERVIDADSGTTKLDLLRYYASAAGLMLPHLQNRPLAMLRLPDGVGGEAFFQKHADAREIAGMRQMDPAFDPGHDALLVADEPLALLSAVQMNAVEFHTWNASVPPPRSRRKPARIALPDRLTFDLDPGDNVSWPQVQEGAQLLGAFLKELGLESFLKTSGGKGLHIVLPLSPKADWDTVKGFGQQVAQHMAEVIPARFVAKSGPKNRVGKIYIDYLRNGYGATTVAAWSVRARPGLGVSVPVAWDELPKLSSSTHWTVANVDSRLELGNTPWDAYEGAAQTLAAAMERLG